MNLISISGGGGAEDSGKQEAETTLFLKENCDSAGFVNGGERRGKLKLKEAMEISASFFSLLLIEREGDQLMDRV